MKKITAIIFALLTIVSTANALDMQLGPMVAVKAGVNGVDTPENRQNGMAFSKLPDFGLSANIPLTQSQKIGLHANLGLHTYSYVIKDFNTTEKFVHNLSYFAFNPNLYFNGFIMGFNFGLPMSADVEGSKIDTDKLNMLIEFRLGGHFNLMSDETGSLNVFFYAGYMLNNVINDFKQNDPLKGIIPYSEEQHISDDLNMRAASISIGFNYLFNLTL
jgi:hypothetical protein